MSELCPKCPVPCRAGLQSTAKYADPVQYIGANVPQAWAAGSVFMLTQALLGFLPAAPHNKLYVDPYLPTWLPDLTVHDIRIGKSRLWAWN